jgi:hypothetical protein
MSNATLQHSSAGRRGPALTLPAVCFVLCAVRMDARLRSDRYFGYARQQRFDFRTMHKPTHPPSPFSASRLLPRLARYARFEPGDMASWASHPLTAA